MGPERVLRLEGTGVVLFDNYPIIVVLFMINNFFMTYDLGNVSCKVCHNPINMTCG